MSNTTTPAPVMHHEFPPSKMALFQACPGAWALGKKVPQDDGKGNPFAEEGTMLHARVATGDLSGLTEEQASAVKECLAFIEDYKSGHVGEFERQSEVQVTLADELSGEQLTFGTADCLLVNKKPEYGVWGAVVDWKFGRGEVPEAQDNLQLAIYAAALIQRHGMAVEAAVVQPRLHKVSTFVYEPDMADAITETVIAIENECKTNPDKLVIGAHCAFCPAKGMCPKQRETTESVAKAAPVLAPMLKELPDERIGILYAQTLAVGKFGEAVKEELLSRIQNGGGSAGGWTAKVKSGGYTVKDTNEAFNLVKSVIPADVFASLCTVTLSKIKVEYAARAKEAGLVKSKKDGEIQAFNLLKDVLEARPDVISIIPDKP